MRSACLIVLCQSVPSRAAGVLISCKRRPPCRRRKVRAVVDRRGITRGPKIELLSGSDNIQSPTHFQLKFLSFGGATIDVTSVKVIYLRTPNVDLTERLKVFVQPAGIDMPDASLPPGEHMLRVDLRDSDGRPGSTSFVLKVAR